MKLFISMFAISLFIIYVVFVAYVSLTGSVNRWCVGESLQRPNWTCYQTKKSGYLVFFEKVGKK